MMRYKLLSLSAAFLTLALVVSLAGPFPLPVIADDAKAPKSEASPSGTTTKKEDLRYDGKPFGYWQKYVLTELKADRRIEACRALAAFGTRGYAEEAASSIIEMCKDYNVDTLADDDIEWKVLHNASRALTLIGKEGMRVYLEKLSSPNDHERRLSMAVLCDIPISSVEARALSQLIRGKNPKVRDAAILVLGTHKGEKEVKDFLKTELTDKEKARALAVAFGGALKNKKLAYAMANASTAGAQLLKDMGPLARPAVPALLDALAVGSTIDYGDTGFHDGSLEALQAIGTAPMKLVPALIKRLEPRFIADNYVISIRVIATLGDLGPAANDALPALKNVEAGDNLLVGEAVSLAIQKITKK